MAKQIFIIEGPAGSGKSTLIEAFRGDWLKFHLVKTARTGLSIPRDFGLESGAALSQYKDFMNLSEAITVPEENVVIDRCFVSQGVYHCLRTNNQSGFKKYFEELSSHLATSAMMLALDYSHRSFEVVADIPRIHILFNLIPTLELEKRRENHPGKYPFDARNENSLYRNAYLEMKKSSNGTIVSVAAITTEREALNYMRGYIHE